MAENRYAGISPFTGEQKNVFFGRTSDIEKFYQQLKIEQQTLLYSKSGLGKSSLINAGIIPKLENEGIYTPIRIRFNAFTGTNDTIPVQKVVNEITSKIELSANSLIDEVGIAENDKNLWFLFKKMQLLYPEKRLILIFDQFEELFSYSEPIIEDFKNQLSDILKADVPENFVEYFAKARSKNKEKFRGKQMRLLNENVEVKTIYIIRSDKLSLLNKLRNRIANIQKSYYELLPLTAEQAHEAIVKPAEMQGEFKTLNFSYKPESLTKIINFLTNKGEQAIETTQLQIICQRIEQNIFEHHRQKENYEVGENDLPDFKDIFLSFYTDAINSLDIKEREKAAKLIENESIRNKQRISLDEYICSEYISVEALKLLVDNRLLRSEQNSFGRYSYELSHDTLVEPISEAAEKRKRKEEKQRLEKERELERQIAREK